MSWPPKVHLNTALTPGLIKLTMADLGRSLTGHTGAVGTQLLPRDVQSARLGLPGRPLVALPGVPPAPLSSPGLNPVARRADLARVVRHCADLGLEVDLRHGHAAQRVTNQADRPSCGTRCEAASASAWVRVARVAAACSTPLLARAACPAPGHIERRAAVCMGARQRRHAVPRRVTVPSQVHLDEWPSGVGSSQVRCLLCWWKRARRVRGQHPPQGHASRTVQSKTISVTGSACVG